MSVFAWLEVTRYGKNELTGSLLLPHNLRGCFLGPLLLRSGHGVARFLFFLTSVSILVGIVGKDAQIRTYLTGQLGLSLLAGLVTLVAAGHFCGEWAEAWFMFL